ncbi:major capsid protein [Apis mellifera associated microvirus 35]|nr:major capsid protein [Apis mellifera associated microvirus 35]
MSRKNNIFKQVPVTAPKRNLFDLSHEVKTSMKFGKLYPVLLLDCIPGDVIDEQATAMVRFAPMLSPVYHRVNVTTHFFFVPNRLVMDRWERFITGGQDGQADDVAPPYVTVDGIGAANASLMREGSLWDYMGLPLLPNPAPSPLNSSEWISALPFRAYAKVYNDYYRDPNLDPELDLDTEVEGNVSTVTRTKGLLELRERGWDKDYFTAALPWAQRGAEVLMPLAGEGSVTYKPISDVFLYDGEAPDASGSLRADIGDPQLYLGSGIPGRVENIDQVTFGNSEITLNTLRTSLAIQRWLEANARGGGRYIEQIQSHFGVRVPDYRLQRSEYLGGGVQPVVISEVLATAEGEDVPVGDLAGHGISVGKSNRFHYRCQEHGFVIGIMSIMPVPSYDLGIERMWSRTSKYQFAWPEFAHIGEQEIVSKEIFFSFDEDDHEDNMSLFGYIPRYSEYKFKNDRFTGAFRSSLAFWHLGRIFNNRPVLNSAFLRMQENTADEETYRRIFAVQDGTDYLWVQIFHRIRALRPLPYFGVPQIM